MQKGFSSIAQFMSTSIQIGPSPWMMTLLTSCLNFNKTTSFDLSMDRIKAMVMDLLFAAGVDTISRLMTLAMAALMKKLLSLLMLHLINSFHWEIPSMSLHLMFR